MPTRHPTGSVGPHRRKQWGLAPTLLLLVPLLGLLVRTSLQLHYDLPEPAIAEYDPRTGKPQFSESRAMSYIRDLSSYDDGQQTPRYRIVGTKEMVRTDEYLLERVDIIRREMVERHPEGGMQIEVWHQVGDGSHLFDFMDKMVWKSYFGVTNIVVRLSDGTAATKANAILVNAHTDSTLPSPGAADDLVGVAAMLEALRVMALGDRKLTNSVVFLFNGAEESLQDASHLFITQHPLKDTIRAVINLEACGTDGKEITFQATNSEMVRALARTPTPYATIIASEIFQTGLILSDTDFRQFAEYGNLTGLDMALVQDSYKYHTRLDTFDAIEPGAVQHMGESTLALLEYFTSNQTTLGNSPTATPNLPKTPVSALVFFSALGGKLFVVYTRNEATLLYSILAALVVVVLSDRVDWVNRKKPYLLSAVGVAGSVLSAVIGANLGAAFTSLVMGRAMSWFRNEALPLVVYGPPALLGVVLYQYFLVSNRLRSPIATVAQDESESALLEHSGLVGLVMYYTAILLVGHALGVGSSYLFAIGASGSLLALVLNDYALRRAAPEDDKGLHLATYVVGQALPILLGVEGIVGFLDLFVPLTGRLGADAPVDFIIASLTSGVGFLIVPMFLPFVHRFGASFTSRLVVVFTLATIASMTFFTRPSWSPYDAEHPKRIFVLHMENTTTSPPEFHLHVASIDGNPFLDLVQGATEGLIPQGTMPEPTIADDLSVDWDIIYPIGQFLTTYKVPLEPVSPAYVSPWSDFKISVRRSTLNAVARTRSIEFVLEHPNVIWPVVAFEADVLAWNLPQPPERGSIRHHVKSVASYGITEFPLSVTVQLTASEFAAAQHREQLAKGQRTDRLADDDHLGLLKVDFSGLDPHGMYPASLVADDSVEQGVRDRAQVDKLGLRFFRELEKKLEREPVDSMLLSAVAGVAYI
ncbi:hypothetical protein JCM10212_003240 [Sporobolomyces blumeae]